MNVRYADAGAREGIRELISELWKSQKGGNAQNVLLYIHSMKWVHLVAAGCEQPRALLIRPVNEFTLGYTTQVPCDDPAFDNHAEVLRTDEGQWYFRENGHILSAAEFASKLLNLVAETDPVR